MADDWRVWTEPETVDMSDRSAVATLLGSLMRDFIDYRDVSPAMVGRIEQLLDTFEGTEWWEELETPVASYEPWGGGDEEELFTASELRRLFSWALPFVDAEARGEIGQDASERPKQ